MVVMRYIIVLLLGMVFACTQDKEINIWHKVSTDGLNPGAIIALDMTKGYAFSDHQFVYIVVQLLDSEEQIVVAFPNGGYWSAPEPDPFLKELQQEFDSLEDYLRNLESKEIKKK